MKGLQLLPGCARKFLSGDVTEVSTMLQTGSRYLSWPRKNNILVKLGENDNENIAPRRDFVVSADHALFLAHDGQCVVWSEGNAGTVHLVAPEGGV